LTPPNPNLLDLIDPPVFPLPSPPPEEEVDQMANLNRPLNIAAYPIFYGLPRTDPDMHVSRFLAVCAANRVLNQDYLRTFPATLDGAAFSWYQKQPKIATWDALRDAFIAQYRPLGFRESVATQDRVIPYYAPNSSIKHNKSDSKDCSQEIL
jgi:hypothetical protein